MKALLSHLGAWAPMAEQKALAKFLLEKNNIENYFLWFKSQVELRLNKIYNGIISLKQKGFNVDAIAPQAAIYLTIKIDLVGKKTQAGKILEQQTAVTDYLLSEAKLAIVPFAAFGADTNSTWYRVSVGVVKLEDIDNVINSLEEALQKLS
jgi:aspartate aminotransferase